MNSYTILKAFDGHTFHPHGIISTFLIELGGETVSIEVEVVDAPIDYKFLLGIAWLYEINEVGSLVFCVHHFPHQGKIVTIDQLGYCTPNLRTNASTNVPFVRDSP